MNDIHGSPTSGDEKKEVLETMLYDSFDHERRKNGAVDNRNIARRSPNPIEKAGICSKIFFLWIYPLVKLGKERPLEDSDLSSLPDIDSSDCQRKHMERIIQQERQQKTPLLARALFRDYWNRTRLARWILMVNVASRLVQSVALGRILRILDSSEPMDPLDGYGSAALLVACGLLAFPTKQQQFFETYRVGLQLRTSLMASIYSKILRLPSVGDEANRLTSGHVTNLASNDVERFVGTAVYCNFIVWGPLEAVFVLILGVFVVGPAFCAGYALLCLLLPFQFWLGRRFAHYRDQIAQETDARVSWVQQAVHGARIMKYNGFEHLFLDRITTQRQKEVDKLQTTSGLKALNEAIYYCSSAVVASFIFCIHVVIGGSLTPEIVYTTLTLLGILQFTLTKHIPMAVMGLSECYVSCERLQAFLDLPETAAVEDARLKEETDKDGLGELNTTLMKLSNVTCHWDFGFTEQSSKPSKVALMDISLNFESGKLYCVIGKIGSAKSSLLQVLSGELPLTSGTIHRGSSAISYAAQEAWIMDGTIRDNIVMGLAFDQEWYDVVVDACALRHDLAQFLNGDETLVGDRGVQCSGGQKARIGLARAFYNKQSEILLLDDPLSAVDARVANTIFFSAIQKLGVGRGKCVILVTHQHQFVGNADQCIVLDGGKVAATGSYEECKAKTTASWTTEIQQTTVDEFESETKLPSENNNVKWKENQEEKRVTGVVKWDTWKSYLSAFGGYPSCAAFLAVFLVTQVTQLATFVVLGNWAEVRPRDDQNNVRWFYQVTGAVALLVVSSVVRAQLSFAVLVGCSRKLHDSMSHAVLRAKISFFDTNPLGRILNRFSADVGITDELLPRKFELVIENPYVDLITRKCLTDCLLGKVTIYDFMVGAFMFFGSVCTTIVVLPVVLVVIPPLTVVFTRNRRSFVATSRELKRLEGLARSPIYATLSETMLGIATIRSTGSVGFFSQKFSVAHDKHTRAAWAFMSSSRWFAISLDMLSFLLLMTATFAAVLFHHQNWLKMDPATLGLALMLLIQMSNTNFPWMIRQSAEITNQMVSVERILEFCRLESEAPLQRDADKLLDESWPERGNIEVSNLSVRYRPGLPLALDNVAFTLVSGSRVGIVGRTGSGKSTLVQSLFRVLEADEGTIHIDGVDIATIGLHRLRKGISVIPQAPTLFSGCTIRENLDLFGVHTDAEIAGAIDDSHLKELVDSLPAGMHSLVSEGGSNFSVGQRQLLCLARAIVSRNKILVLDEATANVDRRTDKLIQDTLEHSFQDGTIIAVAHRLETILNSDSIIVMGNAKVLEQDSPKALLADSSSHFFAMAKSGGYAMRQLDNQEKT